MASPLSVLSGIVAHAALPEPPTFSDNYYIGQQVFLALDKGGAHFAPDGGMCCSKISDSSCSFEVISQGSDLYNYGDMQLTSTGTVVSNYSTLPTEQYGRQYALKPAAAGSSYKYECAVYCPLSSSYFNVIAIGDGRKQDPVSFMGNETVNNGGVLRSRAGLCPNLCVAIPFLALSRDSCPRSCSTAHSTIQRDQAHLSLPLGHGAHRAHV